MPVGSKTVVRRYGLPISAATVRSEMARLEDEGYITHPHTSAGRIPSDKGYRFYVESLMEEEELPWNEKQAIQHRLYGMARTATGRAELVEDQARMAAAVLAESVRNAAVATAPRAPRCRLQHLELVELPPPPRVLLVAVFAEAYVRQRILSVAEEPDQDELATTAGRLSESYSGLTSEEVRISEPMASTLDEQVTEAVAELMSEEDQALFDQAYLDGLRNVLSQPEFAQTDAVIDLLCVLEEGNLMKAIPFESLGEGVMVVIGQENREDVMRRCSVVLTRYGTPGAAVGALAVLGPTRMAYSRVIPTVRYLSSLMGRLVAQD
jgi:heat-inducible transcriptional repressor